MADDNSNDYRGSTYKPTSPYDTPGYHGKYSDYESVGAREDAGVDVTDYAQYSDLVPDQEQQTGNDYMAQAYTDKGEPIYYEQKPLAEGEQPTLADWWGSTGFKGWARRTWSKIFDPDKFNLLSDEERANAETLQSKYEDYLQGTFHFDKLVTSWTGIEAQDVANLMGNVRAEQSMKDQIAAGFGILTRGLGQGVWTGLGLFGAGDYAVRKAASSYQAIDTVLDTSTTFPDLPGSNWDTKGNGWAGLAKTIWNLTPIATGWQGVRAWSAIAKGDVDFKDLTREVFIAQQSSAAFYSLNADNMKREQYMLKYDQGASPEVLMEMYTNPWTELLGSLVLDPANLFGASVIGKIGGGAKTAVKIPFTKKVIATVPWEMVRLPTFGQVLGINLGKVGLANDVNRMLDMAPDIEKSLNKLADVGDDLEALNTLRKSTMEIAENLGRVSADAGGKKGIFSGVKRLLGTDGYGLFSHNSAAKANIMARDVGQMLTGLFVNNLKAEEIVDEVLPAMYQVMRGDEAQFAAGLNTLLHKTDRIPVETLFSKNGQGTMEVLARIMDDGMLNKLEKMVEEGADRNEIGAVLLNGVNNIAQDLFPSVDEMEDAAKAMKATNYQGKIDDAERAVGLAQKNLDEAQKIVDTAKEVSKKMLKELQTAGGKLEQAKRKLDILMDSGKTAQLARQYQDVPQYVKNIRAVTKRYEKLWRPITGAMANVYIRFNPAFTPRNIMSQGVGIMLDMGVLDAAEISASSFRAYSAKSVEAFVDITQKSMLAKFGAYPKRMFQGFGGQDFIKAGLASRSEMMASIEIIQRVAEKSLDNALKQGALMGTDELVRAGLDADLITSFVGRVRDEFGLTDNAVAWLKQSMADGKIDTFRMIDPNPRLKQALKEFKAPGGGTWWDRFHDLRMHAESPAEFNKGVQELLNSFEAITQRAFNDAAQLGDDVPATVHKTVQAFDEVQDAITEMKIFDNQDIDMFTRATQSWQNALSESTEAFQSISEEIYSASVDLLGKEGAEALSTKYGNIVSEAQRKYGSAYELQGSIREETWRLTKEIRASNGTASEIKAILEGAHFPKEHTFATDSLNRKQVLNDLWDTYFGFANDLWDGSRRKQIQANMDSITQWAEEAGLNLPDLLYNSKRNGEPLFNKFSSALESYRIAENMNIFTKRTRTFKNAAQMAIHYGIGMDDYILRIQGAVPQADKWTQRVVDTVNKYSGKNYTAKQFHDLAKEPEFLKVVQDAFEKRIIEKALEDAPEVLQKAAQQAGPLPAEQLQKARDWYKMTRNGRSIDYKEVRDFVQQFGSPEWNNKLGTRLDNLQQLQLEGNWKELQKQSIEYQDELRDFLHETSLRNVETGGVVGTKEAPDITQIFEKRAGLRAQPPDPADYPLGEKDPAFWSAQQGYIMDNIVRKTSRSSYGDQIGYMREALLENKTIDEIVGNLTDDGIRAPIAKLIKEHGIKNLRAMPTQDFDVLMTQAILGNMPAEKKLLINVFGDLTEGQMNLFLGMTDEAFNKLATEPVSKQYFKDAQAYRDSLKDLIAIMSPEELDARHAKILAKKVEGKALSMAERAIDNYMEAAKIPPLADNGPVSMVRQLFDSKKDFLDDLGSYTDEITSRWGETQDIASKWTPQVEAAMKTWTTETGKRVGRAKVEALSYAEGMRDFLLHDYNKTYADMAIAYLSPFAYWTTRTSMKFVERAITNPSHAAAYLKYRQFLERKHAGLPEWWRYNINLGNLPGIEEDHPLFINLEATVNPIYNLTGVDFNDPNKRVDWLTNMIDDMGKFGPTFMTPVNWAMALRLYAKGEQDAAERWMGRLFPQTQAIKAGLSLANIRLPETPISRHNELDPFVNFFEGGLDPYERRRVGRALAGMVSDGQITKEQALDAAYAQSGENWDLAIERALDERGAGQLASFVLGVGFKPRTAGDMKVDEFYKEFGTLMSIRGTMSPLEFKNRMDDIRESYPFMDTVLLSKRSGPDRETGYAYNVLARIPPGTASDLYEQIGLEYATVQKFYDGKGDMTGWKQSEKDKFMSAVLDMGTLMAIPSTSTKRDWNLARDRYQGMRDAISQEFGEKIWDEIDGYYAADSANKDFYLREHPNVEKALDRKSEYVVNDPMLAQYYGGIETITQYWNGLMYDRLEEEYGQETVDAYNNWIEAKYRLMDNDLAKQISKENPDIWKYADYKRQLQEVVNRKIVEFGSKLPPAPKPELRSDVEGLTPQQQALLESKPPVPFSGYVEMVGQPMAELIVDYYNGEELPRDVSDELDYLAPRNGYYNGRELLQAILISYQRELEAYQNQPAR